jgi:hypothetical protein
MTVSIDISAEAEELLRGAFGNNLSRAALEAFAIEGYRMGKFTRYGIQALLGFDNRWDTDEFLGAHGVDMNYSLDDLEADRRTLDRILGPAKS